jgi:hypothetical protein
LQDGAVATNLEPFSALFRRDQLPHPIWDRCDGSHGHVHGPRRSPRKRAATGAKLDQAIVKAFQKAGYADPCPFDRSKPLASQPNFNIFTHGKWVIDMGRLVRKGEKTVRVPSYHIPLFHISQTYVMDSKARAEYFKRKQERQAKREAQTQQPAAAYPQPVAINSNHAGHFGASPKRSNLACCRGCFRILISIENSHRQEHPRAMN